MRIRFTGAIVGVAVAAAMSLAAIPLAGQARGAAPAAPAPAAAAQARPAARPAQIAGHPNFNGIWQAIGTAHWNLEDHSASATPIWQLGALYAVPAGQSVIEGGSIPYTPAALKQRDENMKGWPKSDPEAKCYMPGIPRATYMPYPFQIIQGTEHIAMVSEYKSALRDIYMNSTKKAPADSWMGWSNGKWEGNSLVITVNGFNDQTWFDRAGNHHSDALVVTERYTLNGENHINYEARMEDKNTFTRPWTIRMPLYRRLEPNVQLLEFKCVEFSEELLYGDLKKK
jgi:hypothetical protein